MEIPPRFWQQAPVSLGCQHCELSILAVFLGILVESWENMSQGLLLWCQFKSMTPNLFLLQFHLLFLLTHSFDQQTFIEYLKFVGVLCHALGIEGELQLHLTLERDCLLEGADSQLEH